LRPKEDTAVVKFTLLEDDSAILASIAFVVFAAVFGKVLVSKDGTLFRDAVAVGPAGAENPRTVSGNWHNKVNRIHTNICCSSSLLHVC